MKKIIDNNLLNVIVAVILLLTATLFYFKFFNIELIYSINQSHIVYKFYFLGVIYLTSMFFIWRILDVLKNRIKHIQLLKEIIISILFAIGYFAFWKTNVMVDDAGFVIKHMQNFADGCFFCFNQADGPVFGISCFFHNVIGGIFAYLGILNPTDSVLASNFIGLIIFGIGLFRLISYYIKEEFLVLFVWLIMIFISERFMIYIKQGLETPLHIGIIFITIYFFLNRVKYSSLMWLFFVISLISKLDTILIISGLSLFVLVERRKDLLNFSLKNKLYKQILIFAILPGIIWLIFTYFVFGSPIPQSANAKLLIHQDSSHTFFPYLVNYLKGDYHFPLNRFIVFTLAVLTFLVITIFSVYLKIKKTEEVDTKIKYIFAFNLPIIVFVLYVLPYYYFNPYEKMGWYYAFPDLLLFLQLVLFAFFMLKNIKYKKLNDYKIFLLTASFTFLFFPLSYRYIKIARPYIRDIYIAENQRMDIGKWLNINTQKDDVILTGFGHIAAFSERYVIDYAGLNSKIRTDNPIMDSLINKYMPDWIVSFNMPTNLIGISEEIFFENYMLDTIFYSSPPWSIYKKNLTNYKYIDCAFDNTMVLTDNEIPTNEIINYYKFLNPKGKNIKFTFPKNDDSIINFYAGINKSEIDINIDYYLYDYKDSLVYKDSKYIKHMEKTNYNQWNSEMLKINLEKYSNIAYIKIENRDTSKIFLTKPIYQIKKNKNLIIYK